MLSAEEYRGLAQGRPLLSESARRRLQDILSDDAAIDGILGELAEALVIEGTNGSWKVTLSPSQLAAAIASYIEGAPGKFEERDSVFARQMVSHLSTRLCYRLEAEWGYASARIGDFGELIVVV